MTTPLKRDAPYAYAQRLMDGMATAQARDRSEVGKEPRVMRCALCVHWQYEARGFVLMQRLVEAQVLTRCCTRTQFVWEPFPDRGRVR
jgi:hypothetical protein